MDTSMMGGSGPRAGRRDWIGLAVIALPSLLYSIDLSVLNLAVPAVYRGEVNNAVPEGVPPETADSETAEAGEADPATNRRKGVLQR